MNLSTKYHIRRLYEQLYNKMTRYHYKSEIVSEMSNYSLMIAIQSQLALNGMEVYTEEELLSISENMQD